MTTPILKEGFDSRRAEAFAERMVDVLNAGGLALMTSIGHRTGLFDTLAGIDPASSAEIARATDLQERYVREWLGAMTVARVIEHDPEADTYHLPPEHAASLARGSENVSTFAQYMAVLGNVEDDVVRCFRHGGGVPYERYPRFHEVMAEDSAMTVVSSLEEHILPLVPGLVERLEAGLGVLDLGCGRGRALLHLAERFPHSRFVGIDLSEAAIEHAASEARRRKLENVRFEVRDLSDFDESAEPDAYDLVTTFDAVHDQRSPRRLLAGIRRTLREDGVYLMQDIHASSHVHRNLDHPVGTLLYAISCMHCMTVSLAQGGEGWGTMWGREKAREVLNEAGFSRVEIHQLDHDFQNDYYVVRP